MVISWVDLGNIVPNPYQVREKEDPEHVRMLAESIREKGLLQYPVARLAPECTGIWQLAFGHSRLAAIRQLYLETQDMKWMQMPLMVQDLTDEQMFEFAIAENLERKDLTPVEQARAMQIYRDTFNKSSEEVGKLFHFSGPAVRNKLRLLDLPEEVQMQIGSQISEHTALKLLAVQAVAPAEKVTEISKKLTSNGAVSVDFIDRQMKDALRASSHPMWNAEWHTHEGEPRAGAGLWALTWTPGIVETDIKTVKKILSERGLATLDGEFKDILWQAHTGKDLPAYLQQIKYPDEQIQPAADILICLANPPACTACPLHTVLDGGHWCGLKACWERKRKAWYQVELERISNEMGIPIYDKEQDGKLFEEAENWGVNRDKYAAWVKEKAPHLRLKVDYREYDPYKLTKSHCVMVISVRQEAVDKLAAEKEKASHREEESRNQEREWELQRRRSEASDQFIRQVAARSFARVLAPIENLGFLEWMLGQRHHDELNKLDDRKEKLHQARILWMADRLMNNGDFQLRREGPVAIATWLEGLARSWGLELPGDWQEIARKYMPEEAAK